MGEMRGEMRGEMLAKKRSEIPGETLQSMHDRASPSAWVQRFMPSIPPGRVLDLACGAGRHTQLLAAAGYAVLAVDRDAAALAAIDAIEQSCTDSADPIGMRGAVTTHCIDLEQSSAEVATLLQPESFAGIVVTNYLHRPLLPHLFDALIEGGVLIYETFADGNAAFGKPSNPAFLLQRGELLMACATAPCAVQVQAFEDVYCAEPKPAMLQRLCAVRSSSVRTVQPM